MTFIFYNSNRGGGPGGYISVSLRLLFFHFKFTRQIR